MGIKLDVAALGFAAWVVLTTCGCPRADRGDREGTETAAGPKRVRCAPLTEEDIEDTVEVRGNIAPPFGKDALIAPQVAGRILRVLVREGDRVRAGQELARIDNATLGDQARQAEAVVAKAAAETALARTTEARVRRVFDRGIAARQDWEDAGARLATAQAGEAEARAAGAIARRVLTRASVRSPLAGVVLKVFRKPGELVDGTPATPVVEVGDPAQLELVATVTAVELIQVRAAAVARIDIPVMPNRPFAGRVSSVSPAVDRATGLGTVRVRLDLKGIDGPPIGVTGIARVNTGKRGRRLLAPAVSLRAPNGTEAEIIACGKDGRAHVLSVRVGAEHQGLVEVSPAGSTAGTESAGSTASATSATSATSARLDGSAASATSSRSAASGAQLIGPGVAIVVDPVLGIANGELIERMP